MEQIDKLKEEFDKEFGPKTIWVVPSKENIETIKDIWSWIIQNFTPKEEVKKIDMKNKPMTAREEFNKKFPYSGMIMEDNGSHYTIEDIYNWHLEKMRKMLERIETEVIGENPKIQDYLSKPIIDFLNSQRQSLNKLKEEK